jgi:hypothetical protein
MARLSSFVAALLLAAAIWVHVSTPAGASTSLPCYGTLQLGGDHGSKIDPACKGAHSIVATLEGIRQGPEDLNWVTMAHIAPTGKLSVHVYAATNAFVAYEAW